jgi:hypothetical protein
VRKELDAGVLLDSLLPMERFRDQRERMFKIALLPDILAP